MNIRHINIFFHIICVGFSLLFSSFSQALTHHYPLVIVGSGPAGCMAATYAGQANIKTVLISGHELGGPMKYSDEAYLTNWPGATPGISGKQLMTQMLQQVEHAKVPIINDAIIKVNFTKHPFYLQGEKNSYQADAVIIATGTSKFDTAAAKIFIGTNIHSCALCDAYPYRGQTVAVIGNSKETLDEALYLNKLKVNTVIINPYATFDLQTEDQKILDRIRKQKKIALLFNTSVKQIIRDDAQNMTGIVTFSPATQKTVTLSVHGIFLDPKPNSEVFAGNIDTVYGFIKTNSNDLEAATATNVPGVFAAGNVANRFYGQAVVATATGAMAAIDAGRYLSAGTKLNKN